MHFHFSARLCRAVLFGFRLRKQHKPFNLHTFRPCQPSPVSPILAALHSLSTGSGAVLPNRPKQGRKGAGSLSTFSKQGHKSPHGRPQGVTRLSGSLSVLTNSIAARDWRSTAIFTEIEKRRPSFDKTPCPCFSHYKFCCHSTQTSVCSAIPACFQLIVPHLLSQIFNFFLVLFSPFS